MKKVVLFCICLFLLGEANQVLAQNPNFVYSNLNNEKGNSDTSLVQNFTEKQQTSPLVNIFGSGGLQDAFNGSDTKNLDGTLGFSIYLPNSTQFYIAYSLANSNPVSIKSQKEFSDALNVHGITGNSFSMGGAYYFPAKDRSAQMGINSELKITKSKWILQDTSYDSTPITCKIQFSIIPFPILQNYAGNSINLYFNFGYVARFLTGDIINTRNESIRERNFNTKDKIFHGLELDINLIINNSTSLYCEAPYIFNKNEIDGLTSLQIKIGARLTGKLINLTQP